MIQAELLVKYATGHMSKPFYIVFIVKFRFSWI